MGADRESIYMFDHPTAMMWKQLLQHHFSEQLYIFKYHTTYMREDPYHDYKLLLTYLLMVCCI